jgi:RhtB (resistance to homoserine/threonine) family protein
MTVFLAQFLTIALVHLLAVVSPGPDFAMVTRNSIIYSRKVGIYTSIGIAVGIMVHVAYCLLGIGLVISQSIILFNIVKFIGAGYLLYIGYKSLRAKPAQSVEASSETVQKDCIGLWAAFKIGFLTNALNPKATLFFLALFTQIIDPATPKIIQLAYGIETMIITFVWFALVSLFFSNLFIRRKIGKVQHYVERVTGAVLIALGIKVALANK